MAAGKGFPNVIVTLDATDRRIDQGLLFTSVVNEPAVPTAGTLDMLIRTGTKVPGVILKYFYGSQSTVEAYEKPIIDTPGTQVEAINHNRNRQDLVSETTFFKDPVITDLGLPLLEPITLPGGTTGQNTAGGADETLFYVLEPNTDYIVRLTNGSNTDTPMTIIANSVDFVGPLSSGT